MSNLMKTLTIGDSTYEVCDASARKTLDDLAVRVDDAMSNTAGYYTPEVTQTGENTMTVEFTPSVDVLPTVEPVTVTLPQGPQGPQGEPGPQGEQGPQGEPGQSSDVTKEYVDSKHVTAKHTLFASVWNGSGPYTLSVMSVNILATDFLHIQPVYDANVTTALAQQKAWAMVSKAVPGSGSITFTCFEEKPSVNITIQVEVNR